MMTEPPKRADGTCSACIGGLCKYHQDQLAKADDERYRMLTEVNKSAHNHEVGRFAAEMELESDEIGTGWEKAERMLKKKHS